MDARGYKGYKGRRNEYNGYRGSKGRRAGRNTKEYKEYKGTRIEGVREILGKTRDTGNIEVKMKEVIKKIDI